MKRDSYCISPSASTLGCRFLGLSFLTALWFRDRSGTEGLILVLLLSTLSLARWRFPRFPAWTVLVDQAICGAAILIWPDAAFGLAIPALDGVAAGFPWLALPALAIVSALGSWSIALAAALTCAACLGATARLWSREVAAARRDADRDRGERYELESLKTELLSANVRSARMAEAAVRSRIARDLHDHAGHELTAAHLAIQAFVKLRDEGDPEAEEMLDQARRRIADGLELLRSTARRLAPARAEGLGAFEEICRRFTVCPVSLEVHGDTGRIPIHVWSVLEPCLKEALSNGARHVGARRIVVSLDIGPSIARLSVLTGSRGAGGGAADSEASGQGLRNLRQRARAVGGSVSAGADGVDGFRLVCVLPLDDPPGSRP